MKQFNLEEYLKNPERKVITRDGKDVRIICTDAKTLIGKPIVAMVYDSHGEDETDLTYYPDGRSLFATESPFDLFFAPTKRGGWVNIYDNNDTFIIGNLFSTKQEAESNVCMRRVYIATAKLEWEE